MFRKGTRTEGVTWVRKVGKGEGMKLQYYFVTRDND